MQGVAGVTEPAKHPMTGRPVATALDLLAALSPGMLDVLAMRHSHFHHGHSVEADLSREPGRLTDAGRAYVRDACDLLRRGAGQRANARIKLVRAMALLMAELDRLDLETDRENGHG